MQGEVNRTTPRPRVRWCYKCLDREAPGSCCVLGPLDLLLADLQSSVHMYHILATDFEEQKWVRCSLSIKYNLMMTLSVCLTMFFWDTEKRVVHAYLGEGQKTSQGWWVIWCGLLEGEPKPGPVDGNIFWENSEEHSLGISQISSILVLKPEYQTLLSSWLFFFVILCLSTSHHSHCF